MAVNLESIVTGSLMRPPKIVVYGPGGLGKTTFASQAHKPIFVFTEEGQGMLDLARFPLCRTWPDIIDCCQVLYDEKHDYKTVVIDTIDSAEPLLWDYTCKQARQAEIDTNEGDFGYGRGYAQAANHGRILLQWLDRLRDDKDMAVIVLAHSDSVKFEDPGSQTYNRYDLNLHKRLSARVSFWADAILFANYKTDTVKDDSGFGKKRIRAVGTGKRVLYTEARPAFNAKNRYNLPPEMPLDWATFQAAFSPTQKD